MAATYVTKDKHGVMRVAHTHVMLDSVVGAFHEGCTAESIRDQYPTLTLEQVYGAIAHYLAHRSDVDAYLNRQDAVWAKWTRRAVQQPNAVVRRLRAKRHQRGAESA